MFSGNSLTFKSQKQRGPQLLAFSRRLFLEFARLVITPLFPSFSKLTRPDLPDRKNRWIEKDELIYSIAIELISPGGYYGEKGSEKIFQLLSNAYDLFRI